MKTAVIAASGPSLTKADLDFCKGKAKLYAVNDVYLLAPWADVLYGCDLEWWDHHFKNAALRNFEGEKWTINRTAATKFGLNYIPGVTNKKFSNDPSYIATGGNSGFQAFNLAFLQGAERIVLLGFDMKLAEHKQRHFFGNHPGKMNKNSNYKDWISKFKKAMPFISIPVINCTRSTALDCFPLEKLENVL